MENKIDKCLFFYYNLDGDNMKKIIMLLLIIILVGCGNKKELKENIDDFKDEYNKTLLTCKEDDKTYYYYFENDKDYYYKAMMTTHYDFNSDREAKEYEEKLHNEWIEKYEESNMDIELRVNEKKTFISISAFNYSDKESYIHYFGDRYNLSKEEINKTFNNECLIKSIKK